MGASRVASQAGGVESAGPVASVGSIETAGGVACDG